MGDSDAGADHPLADGWGDRRPDGHSPAGGLARQPGRWRRSASDPLHAATPVAPVRSSPYYPSSRRWKNPLLLRVKAEIPGAAESAVVQELAAQGPAGLARQ